MMFRHQVIITNPVWYYLFLCIYVYQFDVLELMVERELVGLDINGYGFAKFMKWNYTMLSFVLQLVFKDFGSVPFLIF